MDVKNHELYRMILKIKGQCVDGKESYYKLGDPEEAFHTLLPEYEWHKNKLVHVLITKTTEQAYWSVKNIRFTKDFHPERDDLIFEHRWCD